MLGLVQFKIFIDDLEQQVTSEVAKFTADNKLFKVVKMKADYEELQKDLRKLNEWPIKWQMKFSIDKCQAIHMGMSRPTFTYNIMGPELAIITQEQNLGL